MSGYDERKQAMDRKLTHDSELKFKVINRRNRLLGDWVAQQLGHSGEAATEYAKSVVLSDFEKPGDDDVVAKVLADLDQAGSDVSEADVRQQMSALLADAQQQVLTET